MPTISLLMSVELAGMYDECTVPFHLPTSAYLKCQNHASTVLKLVAKRTPLSRLGECIQFTPAAKSVMVTTDMSEKMFSFVTIDLSI